MFAKETVHDNLMLAVQAHAGSSLRFMAPRANESALVDRGARRWPSASAWRASATASPARCRTARSARSTWRWRWPPRPKLLLLDEPMAGMGPDESARMVTLIESLRSEMAILLIEHDMDAVFRLADRLTVLVQGKVLMTGTADEVRGHPDVQAVYLGTEAEGHS